MKKNFLIIAAILISFSSIADVTYKGNFSGNGSAITALNASQVSTGTLPNARLSNKNRHDEIFDVLDYGAVADCRELVGDVTSGSATIPITEGTVSSTDVGSYILVQLGASSTNYLFTTVASVLNSTNLTMALQATNTIAHARIQIAATDNSIAFSNACAAACVGGGTVYIPGGQYMITHQVQFGSFINYSLIRPTLTISGQTPPNWWYLSTTATNLLTPTNVTAIVIGSSDGGGQSWFYSTNQYAIGNWQPSVGVKWQNIAFIAPANFNGIVNDDYNAAMSSYLNCIWLSGYAPSDTTLPEPGATTSIWVRSARAGNGAGSAYGCKSCLFGGGAANGMQAADHMSIVNSAFSNLKSAISVQSGSGLHLQNITVQLCNAIVSVLPGGTGCGFDGVNSIEAENTMAGWWHTFTILNDTNNAIKGTFSVTKDRTEGWTNNGAGYAEVDYQDLIQTPKNISVKSVTPTVTLTRSFGGYLNSTIGITLGGAPRPEISFGGSGGSVQFNTSSADGTTTYWWQNTSTNVYSTANSSLETIINPGNYVRVSTVTAQGQAGWSELPIQFGGHNGQDTNVVFDIASGITTVFHSVIHPQNATAPTAAQIGGVVGSVTNHAIVNINGALMDYWSDGTTLWSKQIAP